MKKLILINGLPRAGKDTVADFMVPRGYEKLSFADAPKEIISKTFGISREALEYNKNNTEEIQVKIIAKGKTQATTDFREILKLFCSEGMKPIFGYSVWSNIIYDKILKSDNNKFVVADFRFLKEYQEHDNLDIISILVKDDRELPTEGHASDVELTNAGFQYDYTIINTGTLEQLKSKVDNIIEGLK